jgi:hypothetical protein
MERADVQRWLNAYVEAWRAYDRDLIAALFADEIESRGSARGATRAPRPETRRGPTTRPTSR